MSRKKKQQRVEKKAQRKERPPNPFDLQFSKLKHAAVGRVSKTAVRSGAPAVGRQREMLNRRETLLKEYHKLGRVGKFTDRRLGQDQSLDPTERAGLRFVAERQRRARKTAKYRLDESEDVGLTHKGQSIADIERFDEEAVDFSDDDGIGDVGLQADFVRSLHFGGGDAEGQFTSANEIPLGAGTLDRSTLVERMIDESKAMKREDLELREQVKSMTVKLDDAWTELVKGGVAQVPPKRVESEVEDIYSKKSGDFDKLVALLQRDATVQPTERQKTPAELALQEKRKLEKLEARRQRELKRKKPIDKSSNEDGHVIDDEGTTTEAGRAPKRRGGSDFVVRYDSKGKLIDKEKVEAPVVPRAKVRALDFIDLEAKDSGGSDDESEEEDSGSEDADDVSSEPEENPEEQDLGADPEDTNCDFDFDLEHDETEKTTNDDVTTVTNSADIPYTFEFPKEYEDLKRMLQSKPHGDIDTILGRMLVCFHPAAGEGNKQKLKMLFFYLLRYFDSVCCSADVNRDLANVLAKHLHSLMAFNLQKCVRYMKLLLEKQAVLCITNRKWPKRNFASLLRLFPAFFAETDSGILRLAVTRGCDVLSAIPVRKWTDILASFDLCEALLKFDETLRAVYFPEIAGYLLALLWAFSPELSTQIAPAANWTQLSTNLKLTLCSVKCKSLNEDLKSETDGARSCLLYRGLGLVLKLCNLWQDLKLAKSVFMPFKRVLASLPRKSLPQEVRNRAADLTLLIDSLVNSASSTSVSKKPLVKFKFLTPKFDPNFNPEVKKKSGSGKKGEVKKLTKKVNREMRGAVRELRKDARFLTREKQTIEAERDAERVRKTKKIMSQLMGQESEYQKMKKSKQ